MTSCSTDDDLMQQSCRVLTEDGGTNKAGKEGTDEDREFLHVTNNTTPINKLQEIGLRRVARADRKKHRYSELQQTFLTPYCVVYVCIVWAYTYVHTYNALHMFAIRLSSFHNHFLSSPLEEMINFLPPTNHLEGAMFNVKFPYL